MTLAESAIHWWSFITWRRSERVILRRSSCTFFLILSLSQCAPKRPKGLWGFALGQSSGICRKWTIHLFTSFLYWSKPILLHLVVCQEGCKKDRDFAKNKSLSLWIYFQPKGEHVLFLLIQPIGNLLYATHVLSVNTSISMRMADEQSNCTKVHLILLIFLKSAFALKYDNQLCCWCQIPCKVRW